MKLKVYPLEHSKNDINILYDPFAFQLEIICATLAKGTTTIENVVESGDIDTTISWCENIGATIKRKGNTLQIKGINNHISFKNSPLFISNNRQTTAKLMIPLLCSIRQPFGIKAESKVLTELSQYKDIFDAYGISFYIEESMIRFENIMQSKDVALDGDTDIYLIAGLMMALPILSQTSAINLIAPVTNESSYMTICKILKNYGVDIKHPQTMKYTIEGGQRYHSCMIKTEIDSYNLSLISLLSLSLKDNKDYFKLTNYSSKSTLAEKKLFDLMKEKAVYFNTYSKKLKRRELNFHQLECGVENSLPLLMVLGTLNSMDCVINKIDTSKKRIEEQIAIMARVFDKLGLEYSALNNQLVTHPSKVLKKCQVSCEGDPHVAMILIILALVSDVPIVIKDIECVFKAHKSFINQLVSIGANVEYIHN